MSSKLEPLNRKQTRKPKGRRTKGQISLFALVLGAATIIGGLAAVMTFLPRPSISVGDPVDSDNPFSSAFTVSNGNFVPLTDVSVGVFPGIVDVGGAQIIGWEKGDRATFLTRPAWAHHYLGTDEKFTITLADMFGPNLVDFASGIHNLREADIEIVVEYKPWFIPTERSKHFRFKAHKQTNGKFYWYSVPLN